MPTTELQLGEADFAPATRRSATGLPIEEPADSMQNLFRLAIERGTPVDAMERLLSMRREILAEKAKREFDTALASFQNECPIIQKTKAVANTGGQSVRYYYAPLDVIRNHVQPFMEKHGFSYRFDTKTEGPRVKVICTAAHIGGHSEQSAFESPIDPKAFMNEQQKYAAALTYAKRYAFCNAFGILTGDDDVDGRVGKERASGPAMATEKTREWMLGKLASCREQAFQYAIDKGWIMPDEPLDAWPLEHVPLSPAAMAELKAKVEAHV